MEILGKSTFQNRFLKRSRNPAPRGLCDTGSGPRVMRCGFIVFLGSPGGLEANQGTTQRRACISRTAQARRRARLARHDKNDPPTGNTSDGGQWVCAHNNNHAPRSNAPRSTPQRAKHAPERERRHPFPAGPRAARRNGATRPMPTDDTSASERQACTRMYNNSDNQIDDA